MKAGVRVSGTLVYLLHFRVGATLEAGSQRGMLGEIFSQVMWSFVSTGGCSDVGFGRL